MSLPPPLPPPNPYAAPVNPYAAPVARVEDYASETLVLADRGIRLVAVIVDALIMIAVAVILGIGISIVAPASGSSGPSDAALIAIGSLAGAAFLALLIVNLVLLHRYGQTIAKRLFGIRIVRVDGSHCSLVRIIFARWLPVTLLGAIPLIGFLFSLIDALMIFGQEQRCLHDLFADTIVVKV
jgi:uncharacterized RDD family membrane protein YckC